MSPDSVLPAAGLIDEWLSYASSDRTGNPIRMFPLLLTLRKRKFDTVVYLAPRMRSKSVARRDLLFFRLAGMSQVIGYSGLSPLAAPAGSVLPTVEHEADHLLQRISLSGITVPQSGAGDMSLALTRDEECAAEKWLNENLPQHNREGLIGFGPGSKWQSKIWPEERFAQAFLRLDTNRKLFPIIFGGLEDRSLGERLIGRWGKGSNAAGVLSVRHAAAVLRRCTIYVGNDTGTMHLAASVGTPCVVTMSAQDWPGRWEPYGKGHIVLRKRVACEGCMLQVCDREGLRCLKEIGVDEVVDACLQILDRTKERQVQRTLTRQTNADVAVLS